MKRLRFVGVGAALLAVLAMSAMALASSASATTFLLAFWAVGGTDITTTMLTEATGELLLENEKSVAGRASVQKCSGILDGFVGGNSADDVTELLTLAGVGVGHTPLMGTGITCELELICESSSKVWAVHLPWLSEVELWEQGTESGFVDLILPHAGASGSENPGWYVECKTSLLTVSEECTTAEGVAEKKNIVTGVEDVFSKAFTELMGAKLALCSGNNEETGVVEGTGLTTTGGGVLSVSST
jgi:hypothetical protein